MKFSLDCDENNKRSHVPRRSLSILVVVVERALAAIFRRSLRRIPYEVLGSDNRRPEYVSLLCGEIRAAQREDWDALEVAGIAGQHLVAERQRCGSDQQVSERNYNAAALLLTVDLPGQ